MPRDFDPRIHDGDRTCLFNIDDLKRIREATLADRLKHVEPAEAIVNQETKAFLKDWARRRNGPVIARLTQDFESKRREVVRELLGKLNGRLNDDDRRQIEGAFRLLLNRLLHGPITALTEETHSGAAGQHSARRPAETVPPARINRGEDQYISPRNTRNTRKKDKTNTKPKRTGNDAVALYWSTLLQVSLSFSVLFRVFRVFCGEMSLC